MWQIYSNISELTATSIFRAEDALFYLKNGDAEVLPKC
jgi:hypothetical protein